MSQTAQSQAPIACNLDLESQAERQREVSDKLFEHVQSTEELADGYAFRFPGDQHVLEQLTAFVLFERRCCPFLTFELIFEPDLGPAILRLRGPEGTKQFLEHNWPA